MTTLLIILAISYAIGALAVLIAILLEAPRQGAQLGVSHFVIALIWPLWLGWYWSSLAMDWYRDRKANK